ncbi:MAG TPA: acetate--CoA ligase family protein, partial [Micromonosporaceae bacterium]
MNQVQARWLGSLIAPASVALIGATDDATTFAGAPLANLLRHGFTGAIYLVNPRRDEIRGVKCYPSLDALPEVPQAAVVTLGADRALVALAECGKAGVQLATVVSSGFGEGAAGAEGQQRQAKLANLLANKSLRLLGPNTTGVVNLWDGYVPRAAYNHLSPESLRAGAVALVTQSGACSNVVFNRAQAAGVGVGCVVTTGAQADLSIWEVGAALLRDPRVRVLLMVAEDMADVMGLEALADTAARQGKSVVLLKLGQTSAGQAAVLAHSASLAGDARVQRAACRSLGVHWVSDFDALWELAELVQSWGPPEPGPARLGVLAFSGGEGALIADAASRAGLDLPPPGERLREVVSRQFAFADATNPFDPSGEVIGRPDLLEGAVRAFVEDEAFAEVLIASPIFGPALAGKLYPPVIAAVADAPARVALSSWPVPGLSDDQRETLRSMRRPVFDSSVRAVAAIAAYHDVLHPASVRPAEPRPDPLSVPVHPDASYWSVRQALVDAGVEFSVARRCQSEEAAVAAAAEIGLPVVAKADVASSSHKSLRGLVLVGLTTEHQVRQAYRGLTEQRPYGVVVEAQASGEIQLIVGLHRDPHFGPVLVLGSGGITVDRLADTAVVVMRYSQEGDILTAFGQTASGHTISTRAPALARRVVN